MQSEPISPHTDNLVRNGAPTQIHNEVLTQEDGVDRGSVEIDEKQEPLLDIPQPPEPSEFARPDRPKIMKAPVAPSRQERAEHEITNCPYR